MQFTVPQLAPEFSYLSLANSEGCCKALSMLLLGTSPTRKRLATLGSPRSLEEKGTCRRRTQEEGKLCTESGALHFN